MGSENLFHKTRAKKAAQLKRRQAFLTPRDLVLIVCEGEKTEPNYFCGFREYYRLHPAIIRVGDQGKGNDPMSLVSRAVRLYKEDPIYTHVFCVFDRDSHTTFQAAIEKIRNLKSRKKRPIPIRAIFSYPCFEFWLLLHFRYTTKPFPCCGDVISELKRYLPNFQKSSENLFLDTREQLKTAIQQSKKVANHCRKTGSKNPSSQVHLLVEVLLKLAKT